MPDDTTKTAAAPPPDDRPDGFVPASARSHVGGNAKWKATLHSQETGPLTFSGDPDEIDFDEVAGGVDLTRFSREQIRAMSAEDLRRLIRQGHEADKQREQRDQAQDEALAALIEALDDKEQQLRAEYEEQIGQIRKERDEAKALVDYRGSSLKVNMPKWREGAGNHAILVLMLVVLLGGGGGVLLGANVGGGVHVNASAESNATVIQAETVEGILGERDGWLLLAPEDRAAFRAEGVDPYANDEEQ